jgi:riboflavin synthase
MFTGLVWGTAVLHALEPIGGDVRLHLRDPARVLASRAHALGDSIALNGVCLTIVAHEADAFAFDVSNETLALTTLGLLQPGALVNVEPALTLATPLGGHLMSGHVDGLGTVRSISADGRAQRWFFDVPATLARYLARKGSIAVDGVSLTVNNVDAQGFDVALIPHTVERTRFSATAVGAAVNLEVDLMARYAERLIALPR